jgi:hypothetical protein
MCRCKNFETVVCKLDDLPFGSCELVVRPLLTMSKGWDERVVIGESTEAIKALTKQHHYLAHAQI